jgi:hypothetical protein
VNDLDLAGIKERLMGIVGENGVSDDPELLSGYKGSDPAGVPLLVARPTDARQVRDLIRLANGSGIDLVFSSSGRPRFRGDTVPSGEAVIVDMSAMNAIQRVDRRNKVALIEPGVTFSMLQEEADKAGLRVLMPLLPRSTKSVLASYLEREPITIPRYHWDMTDPLLCTELVFGTGDLFRTGSAAGPGSLKQQWDRGLAQKNPMGPAQTDFMRIVQGSQGTMAAVTWATVKLEIKPSIHHIHFAPSKAIGPLIDFSYRALRPKLADEFFILSSFALATMLGSGPDDIRDLAGRQAPFTLVYGVSGFEYLPGQRVAYQEHDLSALAQASGVRPAREVPGVAPRKIEETIGAPSAEPYFKLRPKGGFLDIFFLTTLDKVPSFISLMETCAVDRGYPPDELGIYIQPIQHGRTCHLEFNLYYDAANQERVRALHSAASKALCDAGAFFSRPYGEWSDLAYARCPDTVQALKRVKDMLDPSGLLNPGKLCFKGVE